MNALSQRESLAIPAPGKPAARRKRLCGRILVAEDNPINQQVARERLEGFGLEVVLADNGAEAVKLTSKIPFDLIFMDIQIPEMDGYQATTRIRQEPRLQDLPIVAMTAHAMTGDVESVVCSISCSDRNLWYG